jgi:hypothetical protein
VHSLSIWKQYHTQIPCFHVVYWSPAANPTILLNHFLDWMFVDVLNPFNFDDRSIWAQAHGVKVLRELHGLGSTIW